jgi:hypothetical protein
MRFCPLIAEGGRVLDLAAGSGRHSVYLAKLGFSVLAVDRDALAPNSWSNPRVAWRLKLSNTIWRDHHGPWRIDLGFLMPWW